MNLQSYLDRIAYRGPLEPTFDTFSALHNAHMQSIAFENLDIHLGNEVSIGLVEIFDKIVHRQRGGWCFEMNSLHAWALEEIGFNVTRIGATVERQVRGVGPVLNHLCLRVDVKQPDLEEPYTHPEKFRTTSPKAEMGQSFSGKSYLADVGFGNGSLVPLPLVEGTYSQDFTEHQFKIEDGYWCYRNLHDNFGYDFTLQPRTIDEFAEPCQQLQTSPESGFVKSTVCQIFQGADHIALRGVTLKETRSSGTTKREIESIAEYSNLITNTFGLELTQSEIEHLWHTVQEKHQTWVAAGRP